MWFFAMAMASATEVRHGHGKLCHGHCKKLITHQQTPIADALKRSQRVRTVSAALFLAACFCFFFLCFILCLYCCTISGTSVIGLRRGRQADSEAMPTVAEAFAAGELTSCIVILRYETWFLAGKLLCDDAKARAS